MTKAKDWSSYEHGTNGTYSTGCRCEQCTTAHREQQLEYRRRRATEGFGHAGLRPFYDFDVLEQYIHSHWEPDHNLPKGALGLFAAFPPTIRSAYYRGKEVGGFRTHIADELAVFLGLLPWEIWPTWFSDAEQEGSCEDCGDDITFKQPPNSRWCTACARIHRYAGDRHKLSSTERRHRAQGVS